MDRFSTLVIIFSGIAAILVSIGVIYRYVIRPFIRMGRKLQSQYEWLEDQIAAHNGEGKLRDQVSRIEERQGVGGQVFEYLIKEVDELKRTVSVNSTALSELRAMIGEVGATARHTNVLASQVDEKVTEVRTEQIAIAQAVAPPITGEIPVTE